jgi:hypothetical protein
MVQNFIGYGTIVIIKIAKGLGKTTLNSEAPDMRLTTEALLMRQKPFQCRVIWSNNPLIWCNFSSPSDTNTSRYITDVIQLDFGEDNKRKALRFLYFYILMSAGYYLPSNLYSTLILLS